MSNKLKLTFLYVIIIAGIIVSAIYFTKNRDEYKNKSIQEATTSSGTINTNQEIEKKWEEIRLKTGELPYVQHLGNNAYSGNAKIKVNAPLNSDVLVIIKDINGKMRKHAYIRANDSYSFYLSQGSYESFFYYGRGWNPDKSMSNGFRGGFMYDELYSKSGYEFLQDNSEGSQELTYILKLRGRKIKCVR